MPIASSPEVKIAGRDAGDASAFDLADGHCGRTAGHRVVVDAPLRVKRPDGLSVRSCHAHHLERRVPLGSGYCDLDGGLSVRSERKRGVHRQVSDRYRTTRRRRRRGCETQFDEHRARENRGSMHPMIEQPGVSIRGDARFEHRFPEPLRPNAATEQRMRARTQAGTA